MSQLILVDSARRLETAGAGALIIGANSMHKAYDEVAVALSIPVLHIAEGPRAYLGNVKNHVAP